MPISSKKLSRRCLKRLNQTIKHRRSLRTAKIETELKLDQILLHVLAGNAAMSSLHAALEVRPEAFDGVGVSSTDNVLLPAMVHGAMAVAESVERPVAHVFVGVNQRALFDVLFDDRSKSFHFHVRHDLSHYVATTLDHAEDR